MALESYIQGPGVVHAPSLSVCDQSADDYRNKCIYNKYIIIFMQAQNLNVGQASENWAKSDLWWVTRTQSLSSDDAKKQTERAYLHHVVHIAVKVKLTSLYHSEPSWLQHFI